ncbi:hypothetical protein TNCV_1314351 [Trichonephila clavipes]|nr:hypothetical protein TNCV_2091591 [Trichonephila clavipes]GFU32373.1 hypothetical protein TNCV_1314351 [Trichonephila clavipes]
MMFSWKDSLKHREKMMVAPSRTTRGPNSREGIAPHTITEPPYCLQLKPGSPHEMLPADEHASGGLE